MDKPVNLPVRDYIIRQMAETSPISEEEIHKIISHEFKAANQATKTNNQVEISGLGKFVFSRRKGEKKLEAFEAIRLVYLKHIENNIPKTESYKKRLITLDEEIQYIKTKLERENKSKRNMGRVAQHSSPSEGIQRVDQSDRGGETSHMQEVST